MILPICARKTKRSFAGLVSRPALTPSIGLAESRFSTRLVNLLPRCALRMDLLCGLLSCQFGHVNFLDEDGISTGRHKICCDFFTFSLCRSGSPISAERKESLR